VYQRQDADGKLGIELSKDITNVAAKTLRDNLTLLGPHVLPIREQARVLLSIATRRIATALNDAADTLGLAKLPLTGGTGRIAKPPVYVPDFKLGLQHFCIHAGEWQCAPGLSTSTRSESRVAARGRGRLRRTRSDLQQRYLLASQVTGLPAAGRISSLPRCRRPRGY
jgi:3-ketoacyl-CoA synthase